MTFRASMAVLWCAALVTNFARPAWTTEQGADAPEDPPEAYSEVIEQIERPSDLFGALIAAYQADRQWFREQKKIELTAAEFVRRHDRVLITRLSDGRFEVQMGPEAVVQGPKGSVSVVAPGRRYVIDHKTMEVIEAFFDR